MCTGLEIAALAGAAISAGGAIYSGEQQRKASHAAADQAEADAAAAQGEAMVQARKIREAGKKQQSEAVAALAAAGVDVQAGTAEQIQTDIGQRSEEDALTTILTGSNANLRGRRQAEIDRIGGNNAATAGYINAGGSVLSSVAAYQRAGDTGWRRRGTGVGGGYGSTFQRDY